MNTIHGRSLSSASRLVALAAIALSIVIAPRVSAQAITQGNVVVVRVGDGSAALGNGATAVFLDEYTVGGTLVQTLPLPTGAGVALTNSGSATSEGFLTLSSNGQYLIQGGYRATIPTAAVASSASATVPRVIARTQISTGSIDTTTALTDAYTGNNIRSATSDDGTRFWTGGPANNGVRFAALGATTSTQISDTTAGLMNTRVVNIFGGQLYVSSSSTTFQGVNTVGSGLPTTSGQVLTLLSGFPTSGSHSAYDYFFADASTLYVADDGSTANFGGIQKWTLSAGTWTKAFTLSPGTNIGCRGLSGSVTAGVTTLYATTTTNLVVKVTDTGVASTFSTVVTGAANTAIRGIRFIPVTCTGAAIAGGGQPASLTVCAGDPASFSVTASGTAPLSYQWKKNGVDIGGANSSSYSIPVTAGADQGSYTVFVSNACGSATSNAAVLTVTSPTTWYQDSDGDGFGNAAISVQACSEPAGYVSNGADCDDGDPAVHPGAAEICNGIDDDCDGQVDEGAGTLWYQDADGDGYGNPAVSVLACSAPPGYVADNTDCDDSAPGRHPGAPEVCNGIDDDCDGQVDEGVGSLWYQDLDGDGYGNPAVFVTACSAPAGYVANNTDCNDGDASVHPGATDVCNGVDDNCDGTVDEGCPSNDSCASAIAISDGGVIGNNAGASTSPGLPALCAPASKDVWYSYTNALACERSVTASLCAADGGAATFDTVVSVFSGSCGSLTLEACDDDACGTASKVTFQVPGGQTRLLAVSSKGALAGGSFLMHVTSHTAIAQSYGVACGAVLTGSLPILGQVVCATVSGATPNAPGILVFGPQATPPYVLFQNSCELYVKPDQLQILTLFATDPTGSWAFCALLPGNPAFQCAEASLQALVASGLTFQFTNGVRFVLGT